jgi:hypothetical protein
MWAKYHGIESYINCFFFEKKGEFDANTNATSIYLGEDYFTFTIVHENEQSQKLHNFLARRCSNKNGELEKDIAYGEVLAAIGDRLYKEATQVNKKKFCFVLTSEGFHDSTIFFLSDLSDYLHYTYCLVRPNHVALLCGAAPHPINADYLKKHIAQFNLSHFKVVCCNALEVLHARHVLQKHNSWRSDVPLERIEKDITMAERIINLNTKPKVKPYKFLFYNNHPKVNRVYLVGQIIRRNLHNFGLISLNNLDLDNWSDHIHSYKGDICQKIFPTTGKDIWQALENNKNTVLNLRLDSQSLDNDYGRINLANIDHMDRAYFGICTETKFIHDIIRHENNEVFNDTPHTNFIDCITFTEKTWKFITGKMPFILAGMPGSLKVLKDMGYKTFHPYINEAYDSIIDDEMRAVAIAEEVERLCYLTDDAWIEMLYGLQHILDHNFNRFFTHSTQYSLSLTTDAPNTDPIDSLRSHLEGLKSQLSGS